MMVHRCTKPNTSCLTVLCISHSLKLQHSRRSATSSVLALGSHGFNLTSPSPFLLSNLSIPEMIASPYVVVQANRVRLLSNLMSGAYMPNVWWPSKKAGS